MKPAWWARELRDRIPSMERSVRRLTYSNRDEVVASALCSIISTIASKRDELPASWFGPDEPPEADVCFFNGFVTTVLKRRAIDQVRASTKSMKRIDDNADADLLCSPDASPHNNASVHERLGAVRAAFCALKPAERDIILSSMERDTPMPNRERVRLCRARTKLAKLVGDVL